MVGNPLDHSFRPRAMVACELCARQLNLRYESMSGAIIMMSFNSRLVAVGAGLASVLLLGTVSALAGAGGPAPLVGVTGPVGILAAGVAYGGYLLFRRYRS